jgi:hypothetical protein
MKSLVCLLTLLATSEASWDDKHDKHHHHKRNHSGTAGAVSKKMRRRERDSSESGKKDEVAGHLLVNGPLPDDFSQRFTQAVARAAHVGTDEVHVTGTHPVTAQQDVDEVAFVAPAKVVKLVENEAAEPDSDLARGMLASFLVAKDDKEADADVNATSQESVEKEKVDVTKVDVQEQEATPLADKGIDVDTDMPYGDLEPFGREDTAQELTENSVTESDAMVDQLERAEVAEEKRSVFRALTRLRGAAITSFDGVARSQTGNIDEYNKVHKWRKTHPMHHLADEESDITKWAFPSEADLIQLKLKQ